MIIDPCVNFPSMPRRGDAAYSDRRIGDRMAVIGRANCMGLGSMTEDFCREMEPEVTVVIDCDNGMPLDLSRFDRDVFVVRAKDWSRQDTKVHRVLRDMQVVVGFETFYNDDLPSIVRRAGGKTVLFPMWECSPESATYADLLVCLSSKDDDFYGSRPFHAMVRHQWPQKQPASVVPRSWPPKNFVHIAGNASHNRNSTREVIEAAKYLSGTGAKLIVYSNFPLPMSWALPFTHGSAVVELRGQARTREEIYDDADCLVHPQQIPGLSLPINEAAAAGLPIICLSIDDWTNWPFSLPPHHGSMIHFARGPVGASQPNTDELGQLMLRMATGRVQKVLPPTPPTWDDFKRSWVYWMEDFLKVPMP